MILQHAQSILQTVIQYSILLLEFTGVSVLLVTALKSIADCIKKDTHASLTLAWGIALAPEFKLGREVLRTVIVRQWSKLLILGAIILQRGVLMFSLHWEIRNEEGRIEAQTSDAGAKA